MSHVLRLTKVRYLLAVNFEPFPDLRFLFFFRRSLTILYYVKNFPQSVAFRSREMLSHFRNG